jgi:hypothetical protein
MKDLGIRNSWKQEPEEYKNCVNNNHKLRKVQLDTRGVDHDYYCDICQIKWNLDTSD